MKDNKTFCLAPWLSAHTFPNGNTYPCCVWHIDKPIGNINEKELKEIWNDKPLRDIRTKMLNGEKIEQCSRCYDIEKTSNQSYRIRINRQFESSTDLVEQTLPDGTVKQMKIKLWDFRLSNFCNLRCRSCGIDLSSSWLNDTIKLSGGDSSRKALITVNDKVQFMDMIEDQYKHVEEIYFAGGEPLIMPEHYAILDKLIEIGNTDVVLRYSTNFTKLVFKGKHIFEYWKHFPNLEVLVSLDGVKEKGEYIRKGLHYDSLVKNLHELRDSGLILTKAGFVVTYGTMNYEHLFEMVLEFLEKDLIDSKYPSRDESAFREVVFSPIYSPKQYDCRYLPDHIKDRFKTRLINFHEELSKYDISEAVVWDIIDRLKAVYNNSVTGEFNLEHMNYYVDFTKQLDTIRGEDYESVFPEVDVREFLRNKKNI